MHGNDSRGSSSTGSGNGGRSVAHPGTGERQCGRRSQSEEQDKRWWWYVVGVLRD